MRLCLLPHPIHALPKLTPRSLDRLSATSTYSLILLADCIWSSPAHSLLLTSLSSLLSHEPDAFIHLIAGFHSGRAGVRAFLRKAVEAGFELAGDWEEIGIEGERREWGWDLRGGEEGEEEKDSASDRNRWVVEGRLRWKRGGAELSGTI